jgi:hypothetical protein
MTVYVLVDGKLVEKSLQSGGNGEKISSNFPSPNVHRFETYASPIDGAPISSHRQRERDMNNSNSFDTRDLPKDHEWKRGRDAQQKEADAQRAGPEQLDFWR